MQATEKPTEDGTRKGVSKLRRWLRRLFLGFLGLSVGLYIVLLLTFQISKHRLLRNLESGSAVFESELGPIEYAVKGDGPVVLYLHGTPGGYSEGLQHTAYTESGFQVLSPSRPGYLRTPITLGRSPAEQADALALLLEGLDIQQVAVVGHSGGGPFAVELAKRHPTRVGCLVLYSALLGPDTRADASDASNVPIVDRCFGSGFAEWCMFSLVQTYPKLFVDSGFPTEDERRRFLKDESKLDRVIDGMWNSFPASTRRDGYVNDSGQFKMLDLGNLQEIQAPTLVIHGTEDPACPFKEAESFVAEVPTAKSLWVEGGGHLIYLSHSDDIEPEIVEFISQHLKQ